MLKPLLLSSLLLAPAAAFACGDDHACPMHKDGAKAAGHKGMDHQATAAKAAHPEAAGDHKASCGGHETSTTTASTDLEAPLHRGEAFTGAPSAKLAELVATPASFAGKRVTVDGTVRKACSSKGCWMELAAGADEAAPGMRVTFKNYGFFVPVDSAGTTAKVEGELKVAEAKQGQKASVQLVATAVELRR